MTLTQWGELSNLAFASATVVYVLAFVAHTAEWAMARQVGSDAATQRQPELVGAAGAERSDALATPRLDRAAATRDEQVVDRWDLFGRIGLSLTVLAFGIHLVGVLARGLAAERVPWGNMFEFNTTGALTVAGAYLVAARIFRLRWIGLLVTGFVSVVLAISMLVPAMYVAPGPLVPALHSYWLVIHVAAAAISGGAFAVGAATSVLFLIRQRAEARGRVSGVWTRMPGTAYLDRVAFRVHAFAFPLWTFAVLVAGPIWAQYAWGRYWGWDPKEIWAFITFVVYAAYLHARATAGWQGRRAAYLALAAFATFLFNYVGINLFASGLHSYAGV
ncbi:MAG TPA: c-type cytochrome biogenesis protein CcsB [Nocardioidaceae bacterium]|nr:c-type cytochrome biogenesis protein CcsB [Nocardioidaceae bacterium]